MSLGRYDHDNVSFGCGVVRATLLRVREEGKRKIRKNGYSREDFKM